MNHFILQKNKSFSHKHTYPLAGDYLITFDREPEIIKFGTCTYFIVGDFISDKMLLVNFEPEKLKLLKGNFYLIRQTEDSTEIFNSLLSILPIYYSADYNIVSSNFNYIHKDYSNNLTIDKKFILECLLFNYGFFNRTLFKEISLLPANTYLQIQSNHFTFFKHFNVSNLFNNKHNKLNKNELADLFIKTTKSYYPDSNMHIAFTGGFDGRTLVSCAVYHNKQFKTFSFGKPENDDVIIPQNNAKELNLYYNCFDLGSLEYLNHNYPQSAKEFNESSVGGNGFIYSHVSYSAKEIKKESDYLLAGYFGSELFRALHIEGAVSSSALVSLFNNDDKNTFAKHISESKVFEFLNINEFKPELEELINELINYKNNLPKNLSKNQKMYVFVFEEIFRKLFGQWIVAQQEHLIVRTPFIDYQFLNELLKTKYAGANADFLTKNPYKRMNGQVIYAHIIRKTNSIILNQKTGKGYKPIDILNKFNLSKLVLAFALKKLKRKVVKENMDNLGIISGNKSDLINKLSNISSDKLFKTENIIASIKGFNPFMNEKTRDTVLASASLALRLNQIKTSTTK